MTMLSRPTRQTGILARDQILAWQLALQDQRFCSGAYAGSHGEGESKSRRASKAAAGGRNMEHRSHKEDELHVNRKGMKKRFDKRAPMMRPTKVGAQDIGRSSRNADLQSQGKKSSNLRRTGSNQGDFAMEDVAEGMDGHVFDDVENRRSDAQDAGLFEDSREYRRHLKMQMILQSRVDRTRAIAGKPAPPPTSTGEKRASVPITLCPADDWQISDGSRKLGPLQNSNLSTSMQATILHLKQFLIDKLLPNGKPTDILIACRGLVLREDHYVWSVKQHMWPSSHPLPPVLRYRLRPSLDERSSTLTHTGDPYRETAQVPCSSVLRPVVPESGKPNLAHSSLSDDVAKQQAGSGSSNRPREAIPYWIRQYPSDFKFNRGLRGTGTGSGGSGASGNKKLSGGGGAGGQATGNLASSGLQRGLKSEGPNGHSPQQKASTGQALPESQANLAMKCESKPRAIECTVDLTGGEAPKHSSFPVGVGAGDRQRSDASASTASVKLEPGLHEARFKSDLECNNLKSWGQGICDLGSTRNIQGQNLGSGQECGGASRQVGGGASVPMDLDGSSASTSTPCG
mmetsp:Transcript_24643/g.65737  ORF Transcript_24643/g.65737 Transcript_24643/m.65737 type:complete len:572 (-) Transcript_24643:209-1924(-)